MSGEATNEIYIFFFTSRDEIKVKKKKKVKSEGFNVARYRGLRG